MNCRGCDKYLMDDEQAAELRMEIGGSTYHYDSDLWYDDDLNVCSDCFREEVRPRYPKWNARSYYEDCDN